MTFTPDDLNRYATDSSFRPKLPDSEIDAALAFINDRLSGSIEYGDVYWEPLVTALRGLDALKVARQTAVERATEAQKRAQVMKDVWSNRLPTEQMFETNLEDANSDLAEALEGE